MEHSEMPGNPREIITTAEQRFPVRIRMPSRPAVSACGGRHRGEQHEHQQEMKPGAVAKLAR